ncbi:GNAT family N-acetyltransferase [Vagococcus acidifermentans]|nr:GNAT family N-acetyltransferase [Vagococcus acidifermentans]
MTVTIHQVTYDSADYHRLFWIRNDVLRRPLGLVLQRADFPEEAQTCHLGALHDGVYIGAGCCLLKNGVMRASQIAVLPEYQGKAVGRLLMNEIISLARGKGAESVVLDARQTAFAFYEKLGFTYAGRPFTKLGVSHRTMILPLKKAPSARGRG